MTAITAQFRGREELIQGDEISPVPVRLVLKLAEYLCERRIAQMLGEVVILEHAGDIQSFDIDGLVLADCRSRELVNVVGANVSNLHVLFGYLNSFFVAIIRAFDLARKSMLSQTQSLGSLMQRSRILKIVAVTARGKRFDADIDANVAGRLRQRLNVGFHQDADEIPFGFVFADGRANQPGIIRQRTRPTDIKRFILLGQRDPSVSVGESVNLEANRLFVLAAFEAWIGGSYLEEVVKCSVEVSQRLLQYDAADLLQKGCFRFLLPLGQGFRCLSVAQRLLRLLVGFRAQFKSPIPDKTRTAEGVGKLRFLGIRGKEPVFIGFLNNHEDGILSRLAPLGAAKFISIQVASQLWMEHSFAF
jgi:hypothetical protein